MKYVRSTDQRTGCKDLEPGPPPRGMLASQWKSTRPRGRRESKGVAWYRGHQTGLHEAYLTLMTEHPRVAEKFRKAVGMEKDGTIRLP